MAKVDEVTEAMKDVVENLNITSDKSFMVRTLVVIQNHFLV